MKSFSLLRIFVIVSIVSFFLSYIGIWINFINDPVERTGSDFIGFYSVGRIAQTKGASYVYDPLLQQDIQEEVVGFPLAPGQVLINQHLPFLIPILQAITSPDYVLSFYRWNVIMILFYMVSLVLLSCVLKDLTIDRTSIAIAALGGIFFYPFFFSLLNGQDTALLVLGVTIWVFGLLSKNEWVAGLGLSLANVRPHIVILFALPMLFRYRKAFWGYILGSGVLALISLWILGYSGTLEFINILLISAGGEWYGLNENAMFNLIGLLLRMFPWLAADTIRLISWMVYGAAALFLCIRWGRDKNLQDGRIGLSVILALFLAPHLHFHDLTLLLIPIYELIRLTAKSENMKREITIAIPIVISLLLLVGNVSPFLQYTIPYLIMLALAAYPLFLTPSTMAITPHRS